jgi:hypothetical protein
VLHVDSLHVDSLHLFPDLSRARPARCRNWAEPGLSGTVAASARRIRTRETDQDKGATPASTGHRRFTRGPGWESPRSGGYGRLTGKGDEEAGWRSAVPARQPSMAASHTDDSASVARRAPTARQDWQHSARSTAASEARQHRKHHRGHQETALHQQETAGGRWTPRPRRANVDGAKAAATKGPTEPDGTNGRAETAGPRQQGRDSRAETAGPRQQGRDSRAERGTGSTEAERQETARVSRYGRITDAGSCCHWA